MLQKPASGHSYAPATDQIEWRQNCKVWPQKSDEFRFGFLSLHIRKLYKVML